MSRLADNTIELKPTTVYMYIQLSVLYEQITRIYVWHSIRNVICAFKRIFVIRIERHLMNVDINLNLTPIYAPIMSYIYIHFRPLNVDCSNCNTFANNVFGQQKKK